MLTSSHNRQHAFLMGYFRSGPGQSHKAEQLHYAYSRDGLHWYELNGNKPVWTSSLGEGILRDPFISKGPDGRWHLVFTIRPRGSSIGYASSDDLISWSEEKALPVMNGIPNTVNCWAPEFAYDPAHEDFLVYWASSIGKDLSNSKHYCARTKDWSAFTGTQLFYDPGFQTIDASLAEHEGRFYMAVKDESYVYEPLKYPHPPMNYLAVSDRVEGPYERVAGVQTPDYTEGPEFLWIDREKKWLLYYDYWAYGKFGVMESADMRHWSGELDESRVRFPYGARHATMLPIGEQELLRLLDAYALLAHYRTPTFSPVRVAAEEPEGFFHKAFSLRTVVMDIRPRSAAGTQVLLDEGDSENGLALRIREGCLEGAVCSAGRRLTVAAESVRLEPAVWSQVAITYDEGRLCLYVNGTHVGEGRASFSLVKAHDGAGGYGGRFGADAFGEEDGRAAFDGGIRNVRVYSVPLQIEDMKLLASSL
ncbi:Concanavalin A-like lectin/glucanases superfamily protein [Paenibacillus sp. UNCCL117]|uniref:LamG-like jellyroll fold domain-containing protein n=1 Tax=unclassified Paenibacillus TaxID=185978 RepID=UPI00088A728F|nr:MULTISPECIES: LamG-like jellyroll fold domain-containing protein [unclassified Paenibacillus]SDD07572.1 Concanavalin A-like lectin/glucanases superfamily protein [Paenibacillus sp. cl123]SFW31429.1 Concanavalin A-like lectin/glucanases superfamily protein [Paenibacillus sp. UNCCL117]